MRELAHEAERRQNLLDALSSITVGAVQWVGTFIIILAVCGIIIVGWHYLGPEKWRWLQGPDISRIENLVTGGALSLIAVYARGLTR